MLDYLIVGAQMSLVGVAVMACLRTAPAPWRYRVALAAFAMSVAPWSILPSVTVSASANATLADALPIIPPIPTATVAAAGPASLPGGDVFLWAVAVSLATGVVAYAAMAWRQCIRLRWWRRASRSGDHLLARAATGDRIESAASRCEVRILPDSDVAVATPSRAAFGIPGRASTLWIGERLVEDPRLDSVLTHELVHVRRRDPQAEMLLTMCRCLLWWHPLAWFWSWVGRREMELACDEECASLLGRGAYRETLVTLIRDLPGETGVAMISHGSFNLRRARNLMRPKTAKARHWLAAAAAAVLTPALAIDVTADPPRNPYARFLSDGVRLVDDGHGQRIEVHFDMPGLQAIRHLAQTDGRRFLVHSETTVGRARRLRNAERSH
ncbi:MAG: M56 family metallopeptidase [Gammaproteobacteria bacterium]|nr:M56 family metallopeptidase [Gammaproteobacteria bacterium]